MMSGVRNPLKTWPPLGAGPHPCPTDYRVGLLNGAPAVIVYQSRLETTRRLIAWQAARAGT